MKKTLPKGGNHPKKTKRKYLLATEVDTETYREFKKFAKADGRSVSGMLRKLLPVGGNHPA